MKIDRVGQGEGVGQVWDRCGTGGGGWDRCGTGGGGSACNTGSACMTVIE